MSIDTSDIVIRRGHGRKTFVTSNHVSFSVHPGELVAIVGGSGAGKSTILNCMCGYLKPDEGNVFINGTNLYENFDALKKMIGYVPQSDIVYDNLSLYSRYPIRKIPTKSTFFSNPAVLTMPNGREVYVNAGAGFVVALTGAIMTMPGLPKVPAANGIDVTEDGKITGLF